MKISRNEPVMKIMVEHHFMLFPKGKNYSRGIGDALRSSKTKVGSYHLKKKHLETPNECPFALIPIQSFLDGNAGNVGEIGGSIKHILRKSQ